MNAIKPSRKLIACLLTLSILISGCSTPQPTDSVFQLFILKENWHDLKLGYEAEQAQAILSTTDTVDSLFVIGVDQIEEYDWDLQTITLTNRATIDLSKALEAQGAIDIDNEGVKELQEMKESLGWGNPIERALYISAFVVKVNGDFNYGGIFLDFPSQMAIDYPVIRVTLTGGKATLALLPIHIPFVMIDPVDSNGKLREAQVADEAQSDVQQLDFFSEWSNGVATSDTAVHFRALIRSEDIIQIMKKAEILKK